jgi:RNA polymerase sigma factor (sigma-70 family)
MHDPGQLPADPRGALSLRFANGQRLPSIHGMEAVLPGARSIDDDPDRALAERAAAGDEEAFAVLFHRFRNDVYRAARAITGRHEESLDVVQDTFLKVHRGLSRWDGRASLKTWIVRIGVRAAIDATRRSRRRRESVPAMEPAHDPRAAMDRAALLARLRDLVGRLRGSQAVVLKLRLFDGRSNEEIAELLSLRESNVRMQMTKALRRLKEML